MYLYFVREHPELLERAKEVFGEDLIEGAYTAIKSLEAAEESRVTKMVHFQAAEAGIDAKSKDCIEVDYGEQMMLKFKNGKEILFETSEWMHITSREKFFRE